MWGLLSLHCGWGHPAPAISGMDQAQPSPSDRGAIPLANLHLASHYSTGRCLPVVVGFLERKQVAAAAEIWIFASSLLKPVQTWQIQFTCIASSPSATARFKATRHPLRIIRSHFVTSLKLTSNPGILPTCRDAVHGAQSIIKWKTFLEDSTCVEKLILENVAFVKQKLRPCVVGKWYFASVN